MAFARSFEQAARSNDAAEIVALIDWPALVDRAMRDAGSTPFQRLRQGKGMAKSTSEGFVRAMDFRLSSGAKFKLVHTRRADDGLPVCTFRMNLPELMGLNYFDMKLSRSLDGEVRAVDFRDAISGDYMTQTLGRALEGAFGARKPLDPDGFIAHADKFVMMQQLIRDGKAAEALKIFDALPVKVRQKKSVLIVRLEAAAAMGDEAWLKAIDEYRAAFPDDAGSDLVAFDMFLLKKDNAAALGCLDRLDVKVGGDPYLDVLRSALIGIAGDTPAARAMADRAVTRNPDAPEAYWSRMNLSLRGKRHRETLADLRQIERRFGLGDFEAMEDYADFLKSPAYRDWIMLHPFARAKLVDD